MILHKTAFPTSRDGPFVEVPDRVEQRRRKVSISALLLGNVLRDGIGAGGERAIVTRCAQTDEVRSEPRA